MNSRTWLVREGEVVRWVAKAVPAAARVGFESGLVVAGRVSATGIRTGAPMPTRNGQLTVIAQDEVVAMLGFVPGTPLSGASARDQRVIGSVLARVHRALLAVEPPGPAAAFHWVDTDAPHLRIRPWLRRAVVDAVAVLDRIATPRLTSGPIHTDPAPEAFLLHEATGECGLIDWSVAMIGPLMYDLASAVMYVGGPARAYHLIDAYAREGVLSSSEVTRAMIPMLRFRWAVQADYFARRIATDDLTGIAGPADNERGLERAREALAGDRTR